jgi:hypothetical protein
MTHGAQQVAIDFTASPVPARLCSDPATLEERWQAFHAANPGVYAAFERLALDAIARGKTRIGAKALWERLRWDLWVESSDDEPRLNNDHTASYARHFARMHPEHASAFEFRKRRDES